MKETLVSVITVSFNSEKTIKDTLNSILNQSYTVIEYIIVDGSSSDNTVEILKSYENKFKEKGITYKWISEPDKGIYDAMNKGVKMANGELISILNSDDWYEPKAIEKIINCYQINQPDYIHGNIKAYNQRKEFVKELKGGKKEEMIKRMSFFHPASFIKKEVYDYFNGYSLAYRICSDYDFILKIINNNYSIVYLDEVITNFSYGGVSTTAVVEALKESHKVRVSNGFNKTLSGYYYFRARIINKIKKLLKFED